MLPTSVMIGQLRHEDGEEFKPRLGYTGRCCPQNQTKHNPQI